MMTLINQLKDANIILPNGQTNKNVKRLLEAQPSLMEMVVFSTAFLAESASIAERIYCIKHRITEQVKCKSPTCASPVKYVPRTGYNTFCSTKCSATNSSVREKTKQTVKNKYSADCTLKHHSVQAKAKNTKISRYGVEHALQNEHIKDKKAQTTYTRHGVHNYSAKHIQSALLQLQDGEWVRHQHHTLKKSLTQIAKELDVNPTTVSRYTSQHGISVKHYFTSVGQQEVIDFLNQYNVTVEVNCRTVIPPYELDVFLPEFNLAIEYCGLYWHSSVHSRINRTYHLDKLRACLGRGITLITLFEDEWTYRQHAVKQLLAYKLHKSTIKVYARNCVVDTITKQEQKEFLDNHHIFGNAGSTVSYGLRHNGHLVSVIVFKKHKDHFVLSRFASSVVVVGGFTKLLNHFTFNHAGYKEIITFADRRLSEGQLYLNANFEHTATLPPDYRYVIGDKRIHKFNFRKQHLAKRLTLYDPKLSETQNCVINDIARVWDCGLLKFSYLEEK